MTSNPRTSRFRSSGPRWVPPRAGKKAMGREGSRRKGAGWRIVRENGWLPPNYDEARGKVNRHFSSLLLICLLFLVLVLKQFLLGMDAHLKYLASSKM